MTDADREAIAACALDYYEGWFEGDAARIAHAVHPELAKRSLAADRQNIETISARDLVEATRDGVRGRA